MKKIRITVQHNPDDPVDDLRIAARVRRDLWAHSTVEVSPDSPKHGTHRDADRNAYFEFATNYPDEVQQVLDKYRYAHRVRAAIVTDEVGPECVNCGNISGAVLPTVCPTCQFRDISACPYCHHEVARQSYSPVCSNIFKCPMCGHRVRLRMRDPLFDSKGHYNEPLVIVEKVEG